MRAGPESSDKLAGLLNRNKRISHISSSPKFALSPNTREALDQNATGLSGVESEAIVEVQGGFVLTSPVKGVLRSKLVLASRELAILRFHGPHEGDVTLEIDLESAEERTLTIASVAGKDTPWRRDVQSSGRSSRRSSSSTAQTSLHNSKRSTHKIAGT